MPRYLIIAPIADAPAVSAAIGFSVATLLYKTADPQPRTATHAWASIQTNPAETALIETPVSGARDTFSGHPDPADDTLFEVYNPRTQPTYAAGRLVDLGLTTEA